MTMTSFDPTSLDDIFPSGETRDLVSPGMSSVVGLARAIFSPVESCLRACGGMLGLGGAVVAGVSLAATPMPS